MAKLDCNYHVYMVRCKDDTIYTGISKDVKKRIKNHNSGRGAKYTKSRSPVSLVFLESNLTHKEALRRERKIKQLSRLKKEMLISINLFKLHKQVEH